MKLSILLTGEVRRPRDAEQRRLERGSAKKRKVAVACGDALAAIEVVGWSTERQLS
jgi:hypothetical protein